MTKDEFHRHLIETGLMRQLRDTAADYDETDDEPIPIKGEPLSETVIRERRWDGGLFLRHDCGH